MTTDYNDLAAKVRAIAEAAGREILAIYETSFNVEQKDDRSPLTAADLASHKTIVARLAELTPDIPILSEESASVDFKERSGWDRFWLVDPLDGTKEFIKRNGEFTVNIALIDNHRAVLGVVLVPVSGVCYWGISGQGAWRSNPGEQPQPIRVSQLSDGPVRVVGSRSHGGEQLQAFVEKLGEHQLVAIGSSLKLCLVAEGSADIYPRLGPTSEWDTAAAQAVVEAAGGQVITIDGDRLDYNSKESLLNPYFLVLGHSDRDWLSYL